MVHLSSWFNSAGGTPTLLCAKYLAKYLAPSFKTINKFKLTLWRWVLFIWWPSSRPREALPTGKVALGLYLVSWEARTLKGSECSLKAWTVSSFSQRAWVKSRIKICKGKLCFLLLIYWKMMRRLTQKTHITFAKLLPKINCLLRGYSSCCKVTLKFYLMLKLNSFSGTIESTT